MRIRIRHPVLALLVAAISWLLPGCPNAPQSKSPEETRKAAAAAASQQIQRVADAVLGQEAEVVAHGDLARNGLEQLLVVNQFGKAAREGVEPGNPSGIFITRAAVLEKNNGKWAEVLRCDEHLKNPSGYLGGSPAAPITGWLLELKPDPQQGLELRFTPAEAGRQRASYPGVSGNETISVRWNARAKRYQSFDRSHERYLGEVPTLEPPQSILR
jgi:hypothetical protein